MKALILYATKYGAAREIAEQIAKMMNDAAIHDLKQNGIPDITEFDCVIIGSSVYAGSIRKEAKTFVIKNANLLRNKKLGLFISGIGESGEKKYFSDNFPQDILQTAKTTSFLGGIFDPQKAGAIERFIIKIVTKQSGYLNTISKEKIKMFAEAMRGSITLDRNK